MYNIPRLMETATNRRFKENHAEKHREDAELGWYRYTSRFALPVYGDDGEVNRYNVFRIEVLIRKEADGRMYL